MSPYYLSKAYITNIHACFNSKYVKSVCMFIVHAIIGETFACFIPINADHNLVKKSFGPMITDHDLVKKR